ncbi:MAG: ATP-binding protein [Candidatus Cyclobacteriaceae bacterium M3_2C_046]
MLRSFFDDGFQNQEVYIENIREEINDELQLVDQEAEKVISQINDLASLNFSTIDIKTQYPFYLFKNERMLFWSSNLFVPNYMTLEGEFEVRYLNLPQGKYLARKYPLAHKEDTLELYFFIPLYVNYAINNKYVESGYNENIFSSSAVSVIQDKEQDGFRIDIPEDNYLFTVSFNENYRIKFNPFQLLILLLISISIILALVYIKRWIDHLLRNDKAGKGLVVLMVGLLLIRALMLLLGFPYSIMEFTLFNSMYYASSLLNPSLGDLFLNLIVFLIIIGYIFRYFYRLDIYRRIIRTGENKRAIISIFLAFVVYLLLYFNFALIKAINYHSQWTLDINFSINFDFLKVVSLLIMYLSGLIYFLGAHISYKLFLKINKKSTFYLLFDFIIGTLLFITVALIFDWNFLVVVIANFVYFLIIYLMDLPSFITRIRYKTFFYYFLGAITIAIVGAYAIYNFEQGKNDRKRLRLADQLLIEHDYHGEYLLFEAIEKIKNDVFIKSRMLNYWGLSANIVEQKIRRVYLSNYFDKYDINILLFSSNGEPLGVSNSEINYYDIKERYQKYKTDYENIYFVNQMGARSPKRYLSFIEIERYGYVIGHILIDLNLKRIIPNSVYPELLVDQSYIQPYFNNNEYRDFSYAILSEGEVVYSSGKFNYARNFNKRYLLNNELFERGMRDDGYIHLAKRGADENVILVSSPVYPFIYTVSNFSFLFLLLIFLTLIILLFYAIYLSFTRVKLNYATKIQLYSNFAFFLPLLVVSITTLSLLISSYKREVENDYINRAESLSNELVEPLFDYTRNRTGREELAGQLLQLAKFTDLDINLFSINGKLISSTQPMIYDNGILSEYINPEAMAEIVEQKNKSVVLDESVGSLDYKSSYVGVKYYITGDLIGILSIPFFESQFQLEQQIIDVFTRIINIFTFIFIIFLFISYFASKWLTFPLRLITQKIRKTTLSQYNEPLTWYSDDEIGMMVKEYNKMLVNLENSKKALARSEKESAWRDMARQVAHEIKNPLTPMKLTLQHLKRMIEVDGNDKKNIAERPLNTLLHQVDTLSDIATSFSAFAQMPVPESEKFEIVAVLRRTVNLYRNSEQGKLETEIEEAEAWVIGDEQWMGRIFTNLIINGFQAVPEDKEARVWVKLKTDQQKVTIEISDNGSGIPEDIRDKVFIPNFSTKTGGSGIGLAVAKRGIEHAGGKIWFDTEENQGTSFYIELPLAGQTVSF